MVRVATVYDLINTVIFLPAGGSRRLRRAFVVHLELQPSERVLELGCGTGLVTAELIAAGASVVAVDRLPEMLASARRRVPAATFIEGDVRGGAWDGTFDVAVLSFVLHSFDVAGRVELLRTTAATLAPGGRIGILDWASPAGRVRADLWRRFVHRLEPSPTVADLLDGALPADVVAAGLGTGIRVPLAGGRVQLLVVSPPA